MTIRVLAIDDSRTIRSLVQKVMEDAGFECALADDGVQGVARFQENPPDVVITDINMPNLDGYGVISAIRGGSVHRNVPILAATTAHGRATATSSSAARVIRQPRRRSSQGKNSPAAPAAAMTLAWSCSERSRLMPAIRLKS